MRRSNKIRSTNDLTKLLHIEPIKAFRDMRTADVYHICLSIDPDEISIVKNNGDEVIVTFTDILDRRKSMVADAMLTGTFVRDSKKDIK